MKFLLNMLKGLLIGVGCIAPGFSGGAIAIVFGLYDKLIDAIAHFYINFKSKFFFLLPYAIGGGIGVLLFSNVLSFLFDRYALPTLCTMIGLLVGSLPSVYKDTISHGFKKRYIIYMVITMAVTIAFAYFDSTSAVTAAATDSWWMLFLGGVIIAFGTIIPGISASFILMYIGLYTTLLEILTSFDILRMIPVGLGAILCVLLFSKLISYAYKKAAGAISFAVFGLLCGSVVSVFPVGEMNPAAPLTWLSLGLLILGAAASYIGIFMQQKYNAAKSAS